ncbi:SRPBCC domain-containing protein [Flavobacterium circumlabens]|uniref:SRPBCC domain-containing protein n=1 Tax=Flavobacterium circumlabens TaxID=2133765 RepID=A0A4Y7UEE2_9FLAO|nr:SRPBCC domain-containing protein [Flavobacterium circumlabens]TCN59538.1 hypothetical protein EV142_102156 [Flavobacterium circumlabens]TEB44830.1 SRPBCC domain-containing protein [Flavobacterium circumlabens]
MKQYHTCIIIQAPVDNVWKSLINFKSYPEWNPIVGKLEGDMIEGNKITTFIIPLKKTFHPILISYKINKEIVWQGVQGAKKILAGKHYYKLVKLNERETKLYHGEFFTGLFSYFISKKMIKKMEDAFVSHNKILKKKNRK